MGATKIDWCMETFNPTTGCNHGCPYYYARRLANRFNNDFLPRYHYWKFHKGIEKYWKSKKGKSVFVGSMSDLFQDADYIDGNYIKPRQDTIEQIIKTLAGANDWRHNQGLPLHDWIFLTKNPAGMKVLNDIGFDKMKHLSHFYFGATIDHPYLDNPFKTGGDIGTILENLQSGGFNFFISFEPLVLDLTIGRISEPVAKMIERSMVCIIGLETGNRAAKQNPGIKAVMDFMRQVTTISKKHPYLKNPLADQLPLERDKGALLPWRLE